MANTNKKKNQKKKKKKAKKKKKGLVFAMANTDSTHPCMNHGKCKLKNTAFAMGNANLRFLVFAMANTIFFMIFFS